MGAPKIHTDFPSCKNRAAYMAAWRKLTHSERLERRKAVKGIYNLVGSKEEPCECGRGMKTSRAKGCAECNAAQEEYELRQVTRNKLTKRNNSALTKYAEIAISFMGNGGFRHQPHL